MGQAGKAATPCALRQRVFESEGWLCSPGPVVVDPFALHSVRTLLGFTPGAEGGAFLVAALSAHFAQGGRVQEANRPTNGLLDSLRLCDLELHEVSRAFCAATRQTPVHAPCCAWTYARA